MDWVLKSPYYMAINLWNQLDEESQLMGAREEFKRKLIHINTLHLGGSHFQYWHDLKLRFIRSM